MMDEMLDRFGEIVSNSKHLVAFTGAGISSESGIPTYRGAGGLWTKYDPDKYANIYYFMKEPEYYWNFFKDVRYPVLKKAAPNAAHTALVELERRGNLKELITQNIDNLHQMAGQSKVIELHGNTMKISCMDCGRTMTIDEAYERLKTELPPHCECGGALKPNVVFFGEQLPRDALMEAQRAADSCDVFLVIGSSLVVHPAAQLPVVAKQNGASLIIVNVDPTPFDGLADVVVNDKAAQVLPELVKMMED
jgi:NAD-dependent deacetylase